MNRIPIEIVDAIYSCGRGVTVRWHSIKFPELRQFTVSLDRLVGSLGESSRDEFWVPVVRKLKRFRFDCCAAPFSEEILQSYLTDSISSLSDKIAPCQLMYPNASRQLTHLLNQLDALSNVKLSVLLDALSRIPEIDHKDIALLVREPRFVPGVECSLASYSSLKKLFVVNPALLREEKCYKRLIVVGPSRWYPDYIFSAPRATHILLVKFSWITDQLKRESVFIEPVKQRINRKHEFVLDDSVEDSIISPEDLLPPSFDFQRIASKATDKLRASGEIDYVVDAKVFLLEDGWAVFLEAVESASVVVIDLEIDHIKPVKRIKIGEIKVGMFVLLRTGGGGDYIIPVADRIMGENALIAREFQKEWKKHLRYKVKSLGYEQVFTQLRQFGSIRASHVNVHNWMSERSIKPEYLEDFKAIMRFIGLENETEYYWDMMKLIDRSHLRAGMEIRRMLLGQVKKCDLDTLKRNGKMEFTIPGEQSVSITAFQVKDISSDVIPVAPSQIGNPFEPEE